MINYRRRIRVKIIFKMTITLNLSCLNISVPHGEDCSGVSWWHCVYGSKYFLTFIRRDILVV